MKSTNPKPSPAPDPDTIFAQLLQDLPPETADLARTFQAFARARKIQTPEQLLRVVLLFAALDYHEREIAANLLLVNPRLGKLSNQAVRTRLAACLPWLQALLPQLLERPALPALPATKRLLALDASEIRAPGTSLIWRLHALLDIVTLQLAGLQLTDVKTGETLCNFTFQAGEVVLTDRGYSHRRGVAHVVASGGAVITRYNPHHIPLVDAQGQALDSAAVVNAARRARATGFSARPTGACRRSGCTLIACRKRRRHGRGGVVGGRVPRASTRPKPSPCGWRSSSWS